MKSSRQGLLFLAHKIDSAPVFNLNGEQSHLSPELRCNLSSGERTEPRRKRVAVAVICVALQRKTETGWSLNKRKSSHRTAGGWFIQKNKIHPANRSQDKEISVNGSSLAFPEVSLWKEPVEHSGALCCTDYKRVLFRSTWVVVPFSLERFKRLHVIKLNTAVPNCNDQTSFLIISAAKKELCSSYLKPPPGSE